MSDKGEIVTPETLQDHLTRGTCQWHMKLEKTGPTDEEIIKVFTEGIKAKDVRFIRQGKKVKRRSTPAHKTRIDAAKELLKLKDRYPAEKHEHTVNRAIRDIIDEIDGTTLGPPSKRKKGDE